MPKDATPNGGAPFNGDNNAGDLPVGPRRRVSEMQAKLHRWVGSRLPEPTHGQRPWRARFDESRTPGSASGLGKQTSSNAGTAPQADSTEAVLEL